MTFDPLCLPRVGDEVAHGAVELRLRRRRVVRLQDPGLGLDHLTERPERDSLAVRETPATTPGDETGVVLERALELPDEPALADSGNAHQGHQLNGAVAASASERVQDQAQLLLSTHERSERRALVRRSQVGDRPQRLVDDDRLGFPAGLEQPALAVLDCPVRRPVRRFADEHGVDVGGLLDAERRRDDVTGRDSLSGTGGRTELNDGIAGADADANTANRVADRERGPDRAFRIVLVSDGRTEHGHHRVAHELLERAPVVLERGSHPGQMWLDGGADVLRVPTVAEPRRVDEVGEEHRYDLALLAAARVDRRPAGGAETGALGQLRAALAARGHAARIGRRAARA